MDHPEAWCLARLNQLSVRKIRHRCSVVELPLFRMVRVSVTFLG